MKSDVALNSTPAIPFLKQTVRASWALLLCAVVYQMVFFPEVLNLVALAAVIIGWAITCVIWLQPMMLKKYLISSFMIIGFASSQLYFPVLFTTMENKPVIYNLEMPEDVFLHSSLCLLVLVVAHTFYRYSRRLSLKRTTSIFEKAGFFTAPTQMQIWFMGLIGMASSFYVYFTSPDIGREFTGAAEGKLVQALVPFTYAPFLIPLGKLCGSKEKLHRGYIPLIILYTVGLFAISIARNSRGAFIFGLTTPVFAYAIGLLLGIYQTRILTFRNVAVAATLAWILLGPFTDLGTAMLIVRDSRSDLSPNQLISQTIETLDDKAAIEQRKKDDIDASMDWDWDERYLDNLFLARFSNIKFNDSNLITSSRIGTMDPTMQEYSLDALIAALPDPAIKIFGFDVDKEETLAVSFGDFMYILSGGDGTPFGFRIGHIAGTGLATFGWWYLFLFGLAAIPIFYLNDKLQTSSRFSHGEDSTASSIKISFCALLFLTPFWQFFMLETVVQQVTYLIRTWPQMILLYLGIFHLSRIISRVFVGRKQIRYSLSEH